MPVNPAHLDHDALADLAEGLLDDVDAASANEHLDVCADCRARSEEIADVSRLLADIPVPPMPADLAARIDEAIRAESTATASVPSIPHHTLAGRRGRRRLMLVSAAAAAVVVLGGGAVVGTALLGQVDGDDHNATSQAPAADNPRQEGPEPKVETDAVPLEVVRSGTDYRADTLGDQASAMVTTARGLSRIETSSQIVGCVQNATRGATPVLVDSAQLDGRPATIIVVPNGGSTWRVLATGPDCSTGNLDLLEETTVPARTP